MNTQIQVNDIVPAEIIKVMNFGAIVKFENGQKGLIHISQIAETYVQDINEFVKKGDQVQVKVIAIAENGRIDVSMRLEERKSHKVFKKKHGTKDHSLRPVKKKQGLTFSPFAELEG